MIVHTLRGSILRPREAQTIGLCGFCAAPAERISRELEPDWGAVLIYRVLGVTGGAGISIGGPE